MGTMLIYLTVHGTGDAEPATEQSQKKWWENSSPTATAIGEATATEYRWQNFAWSGKNCDSARMHAGKRLYALLKELGGQGHKVILIGHSHGGNVIEYAFRTALTVDGDYFDHVLRWITVGTPFLKHRPVGRLVRINATFLLFIVGILTVLMAWGVDGGALEESGAAILGGFLTLGLVLLTFAIILLFRYFRRSALGENHNRTNGDLSKYVLDRHISLYGGDDEAIAALKGALTEEVRLSPPAPSRWIAPILSLMTIVGALLSIYGVIPTLRAKAVSDFASTSANALYKGKIDVIEATSSVEGWADEMQSELSDILEQQEEEHSQRLEEAVRNAENVRRLLDPVSLMFEQIAWSVDENPQRFLKTEHEGSTCAPDYARKVDPPVISDCELSAENIRLKAGVNSSVRELMDRWREIGVRESTIQTLSANLTEEINPLAAYEVREVRGRPRFWRTIGYEIVLKRDISECGAEARHILKPIVEERIKSIACAMLEAFGPQRLIEVRYEWDQLLSATALQVGEKLPANSIQFSGHETGQPKLGQLEIPRSIQELVEGCRGWVHNDPLNGQETGVMVRRSDFRDCGTSFEENPDGIGIVILPGGMINYTYPAENTLEEVIGPKEVFGPKDLRVSAWCSFPEFFYWMEDRSRILIGLDGLGTSGYAPTRLCPNLIDSNSSVAPWILDSGEGWIRIAMPVGFFTALFAVGLSLSFVLQKVVGMFDGVWRRRVDKLFAASIRGRALGLDMPEFRIEDVANNSSAAAKHQKWKPLHNELSEQITTLADEAVRDSVSALRAQLTAQLNSGTFLSHGLDWFAENLSWNELVHTAYFKTPAFNEFVAYVATGTEGERHSKGIEHQENAQTLQRWFDAIRPDPLEAKKSVLRRFGEQVSSSLRGLARR